MNENITDRATSDRLIVSAILSRDQTVTQHFLYVKCYPLFKSVFDNYHTDCQTCVEFINEIYIHLMTPNRETGICKLQSFRFESSLTTWLKTVAVYYCYAHFRRKHCVTLVENKLEKDDFSSDRFDTFAASIYAETDAFGTDDMETILNMMPNKRYSLIIRLRYFEGLTNEETANALNMSIDNYYNKHLRAKRQFKDILIREGLYGEFY